MDKQLSRAINWARDRHNGTNHLYDGKPYDVHLWMVHDAAIQFMHLVGKENKDIVLSCCFLHDTIEDTRVTYNDVKAEFGQQIADIVYALTNEKGRTRAERANDKYYAGIRNTPLAVYVKLCDRIANVKYSLENKGALMYEKYQQEYFHFLGAMGGYGSYKPMWRYLESLLNIDETELIQQRESEPVNL